MIGEGEATYFWEGFVEVWAGEKSEESVWGYMNFTGAMFVTVIVKASRS